MIFLIVLSRRLKIEADEYKVDRKREENSNYLAMLLFVARFVFPVLIFLFGTYYMAQEFARNWNFLNNMRASAYEKTTCILQILTVFLVTVVCGVVVASIINSLRSIFVSKAIIKQNKSKEKPVDGRIAYTERIEEDNWYKQVEQDYGNAKEMFFAVDGQTDKYIDNRYKDQNVPKEVEEHWYEELIDKLIDNLRTGAHPTATDRYNYIVSLIKEYGISKQVRNLLDFLDSNRIVLLNVEDRVDMLEQFYELLEVLKMKFPVEMYSIQLECLILKLLNNSPEEYETRLEELREKVRRMFTV